MVTVRAKRRVMLGLGAVWLGVMSIAPTAYDAMADAVTVWEGHGSENLPCEEGGHWVLSPAQGITGATLTVNGVEYTMIQHGQGAWSADSSGQLDADTTASATYTGEYTGQKLPFLKLSHCVVSESPTPTPPPTTPPPTTVPPTTPPPTTQPPTETKTPWTPTWSPTWTPTKDGPKSPPPSPLAFTGPSAKTIAFGLVALALAALGTYLAWLGRKKVSE